MYCVHSSAMHSNCVDGSKRNKSFSNNKSNNKHFHSIYD